MIRRAAAAVLLLAAMACAAGAGQPEAAALERIAFGSCARQDLPQPIWDAVLDARPDLFLMIGDNVYADTLDMTELRAAYAKLAAVRGFARLRAAVPLRAVWDDHDYGMNDAGAELPTREASKQVFLDFFREPQDSPRRRRDGIYHAEVFGPPGRRVQVILLDTRSFRSPLVRATTRPAFRTGPYGPNHDPDATVLGEAQWAWLTGQLREPAELRIIASSIQVIPHEHGWEKWANFPRERRRLIDLVRSSGAGGVLFISGDRHHAELSRLDGGPYPLYELTSSSLNAPVVPPRTSADEPNAHRVGELYAPANFGLITIDWREAAARVTLEVRGVDGQIALSHELTLRELSP